MRIAFIYVHSSTHVSNCQLPIVWWCNVCLYDFFCTFHHCLALVSARKLSCVCYHMLSCIVLSMNLFKKHDQSIINVRNTIFNFWRGITKYPTDVPFCSKHTPNHERKGVWYVCGFILFGTLFNIDLFIYILLLCRIYDRLAVTIAFNDIIITSTWQVGCILSAVPIVAAALHT